MASIQLSITIARITAFAIVAALSVIGVPDRLEAQGKGVARCDACRDAAQKYNDLLEQYEEAVRKYRDASKAMDDLWKQKWSDEDELRRKRGTATNRGRQEHLEMLEARIAAAPGAIDKASREFADAYAKMQDLLRQIGIAWVALVRCNERCASGSGAQPPINVRPDPTTPAGTPPPRPVCRPCDNAAAALSLAERELATAQRQLEEHELKTGLERAEYENNVKDLRDLRAKGQGESSEAFSLTVKIESYEAVKAQSDLDGNGISSFSEAMEKTIAEKTKLIKELKEQLDDCEKKCKVTQTSQMFRQRLPYAVGGSVAVAALLAGAGDRPTITAGTPVTPQQPSINTPPQANPTPPSQPAPPQAPTPVTARFQLVLPSHPAGASTSLICGLLQIDPPLSGVTFVLSATGPAVLPNQNVTGTFNANGLAAFRLGIGDVGTYTLTAVVTNQGATQTIMFTVNVGSSSFNCPTAPSL